MHVNTFGGKRSDSLNGYTGGRPQKAFKIDEVK